MTTELKELKGITYGALNIRGLLHNVDDITILLEDTKLDILLLQETLLCPSIDSTLLEIPAYTLYRADRTNESGKRGGGGLAAYVSSRYIVSHLTEYNTCSPSIESMWLKLSLPSTRDTFIGNVYRAPDGSVATAIENIENQIISVAEHNTPDVIMGDLNIDLCKNNSDTRKLKSMTNRMALSQLIDKPTRITNTSRTCIDHIYINNESFNTQSGVIDLGLSDHCLVYTSRKRLKFKQPVTYIIGRSYRRFDETLFNLDVCKESWVNVYHCQDPDQAANIFTDTLLEIAERHAPHKKLKIRQGQARWVTSGFHKFN